MTIQFNTAWNGYEANAIATLASGTETALIAAKIARAYTAPAADLEARVRVNGDGSIGGLVVSQPGVGDTLIDLGGSIPAAGVQNSLAPSTVVAPSATAVNSALNALSTAKADALVSGSNIKTINGQSVVGAGDITIAGGGASAAVQVAYGATIPLDTAGAGKAMPLTAGQSTAISGTYTPVPGSGSVEQGTCCVPIQSSGTETYNLGAWLLRGDTLAAEAGRYFYLTFSRLGGKNTLFVAKQDLADVTPPSIGSPLHVEDSAKSVIVVPIVEVNTPALNGTTSGVTLSGAAASGKTVTGVAVSGNNLNITLSAPLAYGSVINVALAAGMVKDASNNLSASTSATAVTNNIAVPAPVFTAQSAPTTATVGSAYGPYTFAASNAASYAVGSGALPSGVTLNTSTGVVSGTVTGSAGTATFTINAINANPASPTASSTQTVTVSAAPAGFSTTFPQADGALASPAVVTSGTFGVTNHIAQARSGSYVLASYPLTGGPVDATWSWTFNNPSNANPVMRAFACVDSAGKYYRFDTTAGHGINIACSGVTNRDLAATVDNIWTEGVAFTLSLVRSGTSLVVKMNGTTLSFTPQGGGTPWTSYTDVDSVHGPGTAIQQDGPPDNATCGFSAISVLP